jgi:ankyrin repeat protein
MFKMVSVRHSLDVNASNDTLERQIHLAAYHGHILLVEQLLDYEAFCSIMLL